MPTYLIKKEIDITRQEGDTADVVIIVPEFLDLALYEVFFNVSTKFKKTVFFKSTILGDILVNGQSIQIPLLPIDTKQFSGVHKWEMQFTHNDEIITVARGRFIIVEEIIR